MGKAKVGKDIEIGPIIYRRLECKFVQLLYVSQHKVISETLENIALIL